MPLPGEEFAKMRPYAYSKILEHKLIFPQILNYLTTTATTVVWLKASLIDLPGVMEDLAILVLVDHNFHCTTR